MASSWLRRVVPDGYALATLTLTGTSPILMNSGEADVDGETYRAYVLLGQKRSKSLDDDARLRELEWQVRLYLDADIGPYIPGKNVKELLRSSATKWRKGEEIKRSLIVVDDRIPLLYEGPRTQEGLWEDGFRYTTMVANAGAGSGRVRRCRPMFRDWSLVSEIAYDPEELDFHFLEIVAERTQKYGLGDYRPTFGSFEATLVHGGLFKNGANGSAVKTVDVDALAAHQAFVKRVTGSLSARGREKAKARA